MKMTSKRKLCLILASACLFGITATRVFSADVHPRNIVFILVDDMGWMDVGCYGSSFYETPNIDRFAAEGVRFTNAYAACHVCSPSRASILTGKYPATLHLTDWLPGRRDSPFQKLLNADINQHLPYEELNSYYEGLFALFQFMIGNTDIYLANQHNLKILREEGNLNSPPIIVPYDFDFCGLVNAHYASPGSSVRIKTVRDRIYLGSCRDEAELQKLIQLFLEKKEEIMELVNGNTLLHTDQKEDVLNYIGDFYTIIEDEQLIKKYILRKCW